MQSVLHIDVLDQVLDKYKKHVVGLGKLKTPNVLPFLTRPTAEIRGSFGGILGEVVREICGLELRPKKKEDIVFVGNPIVMSIANGIKCSDRDRYDLERFLNQYLFDQENNIKLVHPFLYNFLPTPQKDAVRYASFVNDVLVENDPSIAGVFEDKSSDDVLSKLILQAMDLPSKRTNEVRQHQALLPFMSTLYRDDLLFLSGYRDYFIRSFSLLTHFYSFMYVCQLTQKLEQFSAADYTKATPLYFALEDERLNKRRMAADELSGFKRIKSIEHRLWAHVNTISHLSHNTFQSQDTSFTLMAYPGLKKAAEEKGPEAVSQFVKDITEWNKSYSEKFKGVTSKPEPKTLDEAFRTLWHSIQEGTNDEASRNYGRKVEDLGANVFLKNRGNLGRVLNLNNEMLVLLTAVSVKNERLPLGRVFEEFERRGVALDRYSKKKVLDLFDSLNILDKKSDSGDAQYVKPIL